MRKSQTLAAIALMSAIALSTGDPMPSSAQDKPAPKKTPAVAVPPDFPAPKISGIERTIGILQKSITIDEPLELPLQEMLEIFESKYDLNIIVDPKWNRGAANANAVLEGGPIALRAREGADGQKVSLRKLKNVRLETALNLVLEQVDAGFLVKADHIRIVSVARWSAETQQFRAIREVYGNNDAPVTDDQLARTIPVVNATFDNVPLSEVLKDLEARTGVSLSCTAPALDTSKLRISLTVVNMPIDYAMNLVARKSSNGETGDIRAARSGNAIVVDTAERLEESIRENRNRSNPDGNKASELQGAIDGLNGKVGELEKEIAELKKK